MQEKHYLGRRCGRYCCTAHELTSNHFTVNDSFDVKRAIATLSTGTAKIAKLGEELEDLRILHQAAELSLLEAQNRAYEKYFKKEVPIKVSELATWLKWQTFTEYLTERKLHSQIRTKQGLLETLIEVTNNTKFAAKLAHLETNY